jgi:hypothetical protein
LVAIVIIEAGGDVPLTRSAIFTVIDQFPVNVLELNGLSPKHGIESTDIKEADDKMSEDVVVVELSIRMG